MSTPVKPNIKSIDFGAAASLVQEFADSRNIPTKQYPVDAQSDEKGRVVIAEVVLRPKAPPRSPTRKFTIDLPEYLIDALNLRSAETKSTSRHQVMKGLRAIGFTIREEDMPADGRRSSV